MKHKNYKIKDSASNPKPCIMCNPKRYLKFSFAYISYESSKPKDQDIIKLWERMKWMSRDTYQIMLYTYNADKARWFETIPLSQIKKQVPSSFREVFPSETNECYYVMRLYPAGVPNGSANPRIIGMLKHTVFYIFFLDWDGKLYSHN